MKIAVLLLSLWTQEPPADADHDGVADIRDNCALVPNPDQRNWDRDQWGDVCDPCSIDHEDLDVDDSGRPDLCEVGAWFGKLIY